MQISHNVSQEGCVYVAFASERPAPLPNISPQAAEIRPCCTPTKEQFACVTVPLPGETMICKAACAAPSPGEMHTHRSASQGHRTPVAILQEPDGRRFAHVSNV